MGRITASQPHQTDGKIPAADKPIDNRLAFSFKHLVLDSPKFSLDHCRGTYLQKFLERLKALNGLSVNEVRENKSKALRAHAIDWATTTEKTGFSLLTKQLQDVQAWQFEISSNQHGRVHGFFIDRTFFVVWIDANHQLYS